MWELFKDKNEYNEKNIIGFLSFALMCVFGIVDLAMGIIGIELMVTDYIYNPFVWVHLVLQEQKKFTRNEKVIIPRSHQEVKWSKKNTTRYEQ